jgi:MoxR-like ATPase
MADVEDKQNSAPKRTAKPKAGGAGTVTDAPESHAALARKYRPKVFPELIGQEAMVRTLRNAFASGRIAQAYMLTGVRGVGKTTTARLIARALNYEAPGASGPTLDMAADGVHCRAILESRHLDVVEMDAASHTGIDDIRELIDSAHYKPNTARYKVYIIDEVHMLSKQAFNGLLKTLEEPPDHLILIMTAENAYDLLPTIRSRAVPFYFAPLEAEEMRAFVRARALDQPERRIALAAGSPGIAMSLDLEAYDKRRAAMLALLKVAAGVAPFATWVPVGEAIGRSKSEKLELYLKVLYGLLRDILLLGHEPTDSVNEVLPLIERCRLTHPFGNSRRSCAGTNRCGVAPDRQPPVPVMVVQEHHKLPAARPEGRRPPGLLLMRIRKGEAGAPDARKTNCTAWSDNRVCSDVTLTVGGSVARSEARSPRPEACALQECLSFNINHRGHRSHRENPNVLARCTRCARW